MKTKFSRIWLASWFVSLSACHSVSVEETNLQRAERLEHEAICLRAMNGEIAAMVEMKYKKLTCTK